jgi:hypothetical protein
LPNLEEFSEVLRFAEGTQEWIAAIEGALDTDDDTARQARIDVARNNSWDGRVERVAGLIHHKLGES